MNPSEQFIDQAQYFVFVHIDTDHQPGVARRFGVGGIPDIRFLTKDGTEVHKFVGYKPVAGVIAEMNKARKMAGQ
ncbi:MAG: thioredoxin family protein [Armatimonadetes bacterium]|nr:thioredoxin family protein [Armatimonadota bacterium]